MQLKLFEVKEKVVEERTFFDLGLSHEKYKFHSKCLLPNHLILESKEYEGWLILVKKVGDNEYQKIR